MVGGMGFQLTALITLTEWDYMVMLIFHPFYILGFFTNSAGYYLRKEENNSEVMLTTVRLLFACTFCISHFPLKLIRADRTGPSVRLEADQVVFPEPIA